MPCLLRVNKDRSRPDLLTADDIRNMKGEQFSTLLNRMGLDVQIQLELAMLHAAGDDGIWTLAGPDIISATVGTKMMNYEEMAKFANERLEELGKPNYRP